jgi:hypothetical protein
MGRNLLWQGPHQHTIGLYTVTVPRAQRRRRSTAMPYVPQGMIVGLILLVTGMAWAGRSNFGGYT